MNDILSRKIVLDLQKWMDRKEIIAIKGPRQAGKTTVMEILRNRLIEHGIKRENLIFLTFEDMEILEAFIKDPKYFVKSYIRNEEKYYFFLDEYQYVPEGGKKLKLLYDSFYNIKFIISGSSSLELTDKLAKFLVGRVFSFTLYPFDFGEFLEAKDERLSHIYKEKNKVVRDFLVDGEPFHVKEDIFVNDVLKLFELYSVYGGYPEVVKTDDPETKNIILKNIYETYVTKDIIALLKITDVLKFKNIVGLLASQHTGLLNFERLASDSKSYYREVKRFISILEETYLLKLLKPYHKNISTELKKNQKAYFLDIGLRNHIIKNFNLLEYRPDRGQVVEGLALSGITSLLPETEIKYWRTLGKAEVDFVIKMGDQSIPIEMKYENFNKPEISRSFMNFISEYKPDRGVILTKNFWGERTVGNTIIKFIPLCYI